jgi:hypothetical protein
MLFKLAVSRFARLPNVLKLIELLFTIIVMICIVTADVYSLSTTFLWLVTIASFFTMIIVIGLFLFDAEQTVLMPCRLLFSGILLS